MFDRLNTPFLPQALSDLSLVFRSAIVGSTGDLLDMYASILQNRKSDPVSRCHPFLCILWCYEEVDVTFWLFTVIVLR